MSWSKDMIAGQSVKHSAIIKFILNGFPDHRSQLPDSCKQYWTIHDHLTIDDDLIVHGYRLLIPVKMCPYILTQLHELHQGSVEPSKGPVSQFTGLAFAGQCFRCTVVAIFEPLSCKVVPMILVRSL